MGMIKCFWIEPMPLAQQTLRRFAQHDKRLCPGKPEWGCDAEVIIEDVEVPLIWMSEWRGALHRIGGEGVTPTPELLKDQRWPTKCEHCGGNLQADDRWQHNRRQYYTEGSNKWTLHWDNLPPPGAMWHSYWLDDIFPGPDGRCLTVMTPGGPWDIDGSTKDGIRAWTRSGVAPSLVVSPSINIEGKYHGWLGNGGAPAGYLLEC